MTHSKLRLVLSAAAILAMLAVAKPSADAAAPYEIPVILSLTGSAAFIGKEEQTSLGVIESIVNKRGGIRGRPIHFHIEDDQSSPVVGVQLLSALNAKNTQFLIGPTFTAVCSALMPVIKDKGPAMYCLSPGFHPLPDNYAFSAGVGSRDMAVAILRFLRGRGWTRVALISSTDASGQDFETSLNLALARAENKSVSLVGREHFAVSDISVNAQLSRIKSANPQALIGWTAGTGFGTALRGVKDTALDIPIVGGNGNMIFAQLQQYTGFLPKELYFPGLRALSTTGTGAGPVHDKQLVYFNGFSKAGAKPDLPSNLAWDGTWLVLDAVEHLGFEPTAKQVRDYIRNQHDWVGVNGIYNFSDSEQRGIGVNVCVIDRYDADKQLFIPASRPGGFVR